MELFSNARRCEVVDRQGQRARLLDVAIDLSAGDHPPITLLVVAGPTGSPVALPWDAVSAHDWRRRRLTVADLSAAQPMPPESVDQAVLLKRDVLDALVLD